MSIMSTILPLTVYMSVLVCFFICPYKCLSHCRHFKPGWDIDSQHLRPRSHVLLDALTSTPARFTSLSRGQTCTEEVRECVCREGHASYRQCSPGFTRRPSRPSLLMLLPSWSSRFGDESSSRHPSYIVERPPHRRLENGTHSHTKRIAEKPLSGLSSNRSLIPTW